MKKSFWKYLLLILVLSIGCTVSVLAIGSYGVNLDSAGYVSNANPFYRQGLYGQCTWYCWGRAYEKGVSLYWGNGHFGNAIDWYNNASGSYVCNGTPSANSIMVSPDGGYWYNGLYYKTGHVMFVEKVEGNFAYISEGNYANNTYHEDVIDLSKGRRNWGNGGSVTITGFIHLDTTPTAELRVERKFYNPGDTVTFFFGGNNTSGTYTLGIYKSFDRWKTIDVTGDWYSIQINEAESYSAYMTAYSASGNGSLADSNWVDWQVLPLTAEMRASKSKCIVNDSVTLYLGGNNNRTFSDGCVTLGVWRDGIRIVDKNVYDEQYTINCNEPGKYSAYMTAYGGGAYKDSNLVEWTVYPLTAEIYVDKPSYYVGETALLTFGGNNNLTLLNDSITIGIWRNGIRIVNENVRYTTYDFLCTEPGRYSAYITAYGGGTYTDSEYVYWSVNDIHEGGWSIQAVNIVGETVSTNVYCLDEQATVYCAIFQSDGKMVSLDTAKVTGEEQYSFRFDGTQFDYAKVFLLSNDLIPICECKTT